MEPGYLSRHDRDFLTTLHHKLWEVNPNNPLGHKIPRGSISRMEWVRVMGILRAGCLGLALHNTRHYMGIAAMFYPVPQCKNRRYENPHEIVIVHDSHFEGPMNEPSIIERRNRFLTELFPFVKTPMNNFFRNRIRIGGIIEPTKLFISDEPHETPKTELSLEDWAFYDELSDRLWHVSMQRSNRARDFHRQVPTYGPRGRISNDELAIIKRDIENEKLIVSVIERSQYGGLTIILSTRPWSRLPNSPKRAVFSLEDRHMSIEAEADARLYRERCLNFFKPLILSPSNITALEQYSDGIPRLLRSA